MFGQFTEIEQYDDENDNLVVILKRTDGIYVKLTNRQSYWGNNKTEINNFNVQGYWFTPEFIQDGILKFPYLIYFGTRVMTKKGGNQKKGRKIQK